MDYREKDFGKLIKKNAQYVRHEVLPLGTDCMRIYDRNMAEYPVTVDLYGKFARVVDYGEEPMSEERKASCFDMINRMAYVDSDKIVYSYRAKREKGQQHEKQLESITTVVCENGHKFNVDLSLYTDTGLFLDHSVTRKLIEEKSEGCDVLNLFSYTGSFSVYAASGRAKTVTSVDLSATYTSWAEKNLELNGFTGDNYKCVCMDARKFLIEAHEKGLRYDIIIFDPPAFSNSHKMEVDFDVEKDWAIWIKNLRAMLREHGMILFSTNLSGFKLDKRRLKGINVNEITGQVMAPGFVKGRKGTVRSWIMANDDSSLTLDWSEDKKSSERKERAERPYKREGSERKPYGHRDGERRDSSRRFERRDDRHDDRRSERSFDRKPGYRSERRDFNRDDRREERRREYNSERPSRRSFDEERPRRRFDDERPRPSFDEERPRRRFDDERPRRSFDEERPRRRFDDERPRRSFDEDRPRRRFDDERPRRSFDEKPRREKPYGYDSFRPARNRNDDSSFFWNNDDFDKKKDK